MLGRPVYWGLLAWTSVCGGNLMCGWPGLGFLRPSHSACWAETLLWDFLASSIQWSPPRGPNRVLLVRKRGGRWRRVGSAGWSFGLSETPPWQLAHNTVNEPVGS